MDNGRFVVMAKEYAVDNVFQECSEELKPLRLPNSRPYGEAMQKEALRDCLNDCSAAVDFLKFDSPAFRPVIRTIGLLRAARSFSRVRLPL